MWDPYQPQFFLPYAQDPSHQRTIDRDESRRRSWSLRSTQFARSLPPMDNDHPVFNYRTFAESIAHAGRPTALRGCSGFWLCGNRSASFRSRPLCRSLLRRLGKNPRTRPENGAGASRSDILRLVLRRALILASLGIGIGACIFDLRSQTHHGHPIQSRALGSISIPDRHPCAGICFSDRSPGTRAPSRQCRPNPHPPRAVALVFSATFADFLRALRG